MFPVSSTMFRYCGYLLIIGTLSTVLFFDETVKSFISVMPDLIRHPEVS